MEIAAFLAPAGRLQRADDLLRAAPGLGQEPVQQRL
jgi:hypothetical protein